MKIRVTTDKYEYQGLYFGSMYEIEDQIYLTDLSQMLYTFKANGKTWKLFEDECSEVFPEPNEKLLDVINTDLKQQGPIKSDGGSSSYYDLNIPEWLLYTLNERQKEGKCYIKTEEMISAFFGNDFSFGTLLKSLVRAWGIKKGAGKAGNDMKYETGKIRYYADKILEQNEEKK